MWPLCGLTREPRTSAANSWVERSTHHVRHLLRKDTATGVANDVVQETQRAVNGAVLVVDEAVGMAVIGRRNQASCGTEVLVTPGSQFQVLQAGRCGGGSIGP